MRGPQVPFPGSGRTTSLAALLAMLVAVAACIAGAIAYYFGAFDDQIASPGPPPLPAVTASPSGSVAAPAAPADDPGKAFTDFAMVDQKFAPEWLLRVKKVYWTADGALWAEVMMPTIPNERVFTIDRICQKLTEYAMSTGRPWHGVSVRALGGAEVHTRVNQTDPCRPAA